MVVGIIIAIIVVIIVLRIIVSIKKKKERQALVDAVKRKDKETVQQLISKGVRVDYHYYPKEKPISIAVENNDIEMVSILLEKYPVLNYFYDNPLYVAIKNGYKDMVSLLIEKGADVNFHSPMCLIAAINTGNKEIVTFLLENGAKVDEGKDSATPLIVAIQNKDKDLVSLLLKKGANPNFMMDKMPLDVAKEEDIVALLRSYGAKTKEEQDNIDNEFISAINCWSASRDVSTMEHVKKVFGEDENDESYYREKIKELITAVSNIDIDLMKNEDTDLRNYTPLMTAVREEDIEMVKLFVKYGASVNAKDSWGISVMSRAVSTKHDSDISAAIVDFLINNGANVNETSSNEKDNNMTLLMHAVFHGNINIVATLIKNGANVNAQSEKGLTPLLAAQVKGYTEIEYLLKQNGAWH